MTLIQFIPTPANKSNKSGLIVAFLLMFIYASIRVDYGHDYYAYVAIFEDVKMFFSFENYKSRMEIGYIWLNYLFPTHRFLIIALSAFTCYTYYFLFSRYVPSKFYWLAFVLMAISGDKMLFFELSGLRNSIAINIMILSLPLIKKQKIIRYFGLTFLAFLFHNSVLFFMPLAYFVGSNRKFVNRDVIVWSLTIIFLVAISSTSLINFISPYINSYFGRYSYYLEVAGEVTHEKSFLVYGFVLVTFYMLFIILKRTFLSFEDNMILKLSLLFLVSMLLGKLNFRMSQYFAPYLIVGTTIVMNRVKPPQLKYLYFGVIFVFLSYSFFVVFMGNPLFAYDKYHTIFN
jgi:hypothetical protein